VFVLLVGLLLVVIMQNIIAVNLLAASLHTLDADSLELLENINSVWVYP
jgi:hypothetical protein